MTKFSLITHKIDNGPMLVTVQESSHDGIDYETYIEYCGMIRTKSGTTKDYIREFKVSSYSEGVKKGVAWIEKHMEDGIYKDVTPITHNVKVTEYADNRRL